MKDTEKVDYCITLMKIGTLIGGENGEKLIEVAKKHIVDTLKDRFIEWVKGN